MATNTENYGLIKPAQEEFYDIDVFNENADKVDAVLKAHADGLVSTAGVVATVQSTLNTHVNNKDNPHGVTALQAGADPAGSAAAAQKTVLAAYGTTAGTLPNLTLAYSGFVLADMAKVRIKTHVALGNGSNLYLNVNGTGSKLIYTPGYDGFYPPAETYPAGAILELVYSTTMNGWVLQTPTVLTFNNRQGKIKPMAGDYTPAMTGSEPAGTSGTWVPSLSGSGGSTVNVINNGCAYYRIGRLLWFSYDITVTYIDYVASGEYLRIGGLPYDISSNKPFAVGAYWYRLKTNWSMMYGSRTADKSFMLRGTRSPGTHSVENLNLADLNEGGATTGTILTGSATVLIA